MSKHATKRRAAYEAEHGKLTKWWNVVERDGAVIAVFAFANEGKNSGANEHFAGMRRDRGLPERGAPDDLHPDVTGKLPPKQATAAQTQLF